MDVALAALTFLGIVLAAVFGVFGLLVDFKDKEKSNRITRFGWLALVLILASAFVAAGARSLELLKEKDKERSAAERRAIEMQATLFEIQRAVEPLGEVWLEFKIRIPDLPRFQPYFQKVEKGLADGDVVKRLSNDEKTKGPDEKMKGIKVVAGREGKATVLGFYSSSFLAPQEGTEELLHSILQRPQVQLHVFKPRIEPKEHPYISSNFERRPDFMVSACPKSGAGGGSLAITYDLESKKFHLEGYMIPCDPGEYGDVGKIVSVLDLYPSQVFISLRLWGEDWGPGMTKAARDSRRHFELESLTVFLSKARKARFLGEELNKHLSPNGFWIYERTIKSREDFDALCRKRSSTP